MVPITRPSPVHGTGPGGEAARVNADARHFRDLRFSIRSGFNALQGSWRAFGGNVGGLAKAPVSSSAHNRGADRQWFMSNLLSEEWGSSARRNLVESGIMTRQTHLFR